MTTTTSPIGLTLYNSSAPDTATSFLNWRLSVNGPTSSGFTIINDAFVADRARLTALEALKFVNLVNATYVSGSTYIASPSTIASYVDQTIIAINLDTTNPGTTQINLNSLGLRSLVKKDSTGASVNLAAGDLVKNRIYFFKYDIASTSWFWMAGTSGDQLNVPGTTGNLATVTASGGLDGSLTQSLLLSQTTHAATGKTTPADLDEFGIVDTAASNVLKKITWANLKTNFTTSLGALIAAATNKATPVGADLLGIADSASSNATKNISLTNLFAQFGLLSHAFTAKTTIVGADETTINDSAASFAGKRITWANIAASWGVLIDGLTGKTTPVGADEFEIADSAASFVTKKLSLTNLVAALKTLIATDTLAAPTDITTNNATSSAHGLLQKLSGALPDVHRGDGSWGGIYAPEGFLQNGVITPTISSNNLTVAIKTISGGNPSSTDPVYVRINGVIRSITSALSVTKAAATNWCNSGAAETATQEIDYFTYLAWNSGTSAVVIGFSRIPWAKQYTDFSLTTTNDRYCAISDITTIANTDYFTVIGRFSAILSATASFNWSVPAFSALNLINTPIYTTRILTFVPTWTNVTTTSATISGSYYINNIMMDSWVSITFGASTAFTGTVSYSMPLASTSLQVNSLCGQIFFRDIGVAQYVGQNLLTSTTSLAPQALNSSATFLTNASVNATQPFTWGSTDILFANGRVNLN